MIWSPARAVRVHATLDSLRHTESRPTHNYESKDKNQWKMIGSLVSFFTFLILLCLTVIGIPAIATALKKRQTCTSSTGIETLPTFPTRLSTTTRQIPFASRRICSTNATWNRNGVTVAGHANGSCSASLASLNLPNDIHVFGNGSILVADFNNNRIIRWDPNSTVGVIVAGRGNPGSWSNLLSRPAALAVRGNQLYVSDTDNYRIQVFPLGSDVNSPNGVTIVGRYGQGTGPNQIDWVTSLTAPMSQPSSLYICDSLNHRILVWNADDQQMRVIGGHTGSFGSDATRLFRPFSLALDERRNYLYIADQANHRIQRVDLNSRTAPMTIAGFGQLNSPLGVSIDSSGDFMFIADTLNHRVLLWSIDQINGRVIAGTGAAGTSPLELRGPANIRFDANSNMYVVDTYNCRIQRFDLIYDGC